MCVIVPFLSCHDAIAYLQAQKLKVREITDESASSARIPVLDASY